MSFTPSQRVVTAVLTTALAAALVGACGEEEPDLPTPVEQIDPPSAAPSPTSTLDPEEAEALDQVLALYDGYLSAYVELATSGEVPLDANSMALLQYAEQEIAMELRNEVLQIFIDERVYTGELSSTLLEVVAVDLEGTVPRVTFRVCLDGSTWELVEKDGGEPVGEPAGRFAATVTAEWREEREFGPEGWAIQEQDDDGRSQPC